MSARQSIHMKCQTLFENKNDKKKIKMLFAADEISILID